MPFGFDQPLDSLKDAADDLANSTLGQFFGFSSAKPGFEDPIYNTPEAINILGNKPETNLWSYTGTDWYKVFGYQFIVYYDKSGQGKGTPTPMIYTLPIPPQSFNVRMIPATQATPTMGGVVEETSANVFWLISMSGTTGIAVSRTSEKANKRNTMAKQFRDVISTTGLLSGSLAGVQSAISKIGGAADALVAAGSGIADGNIGALSSGVVGAFNDVFLPPLPYGASGVKADTNGYTESQELNRFLYMYSKLKGQYPSKFSLSFRSYKTGQEWQVILQDFSVQQSAANPMLYKYNIALKGWGVKAAGKPSKDDSYDRFGPGGDLQSVNLVSPGVFNSIKDNILKKV